MMKEVTRDWLVKNNACAFGLIYYDTLNQTNTEAIICSCMKDGKWSYARWLMARVLNRKGRIAWSMFAAEQVIGIYEKRYPGNAAPRKAIEAAKAVLKNDTLENRKLANAADAAAAYAADAAANAADAAAADAAREEMRKRIMEYGIKLIKGEV